MNRVITLSGQTRNSITKTISILSDLAILTTNPLAVIILILFAVFCQASSLSAQGGEQYSVRRLQASKVANTEVKIDGYLNENHGKKRLLQLVSLSVTQVMAARQPKRPKSGYCIVTTPCMSVCGHLIRNLG